MGAAQRETDGGTPACTAYDAGGVGGVCGRPSTKRQGWLGSHKPKPRWVFVERCDEHGYPPALSWVTTWHRDPLTGLELEAGNETPAAAAGELERPRKPELPTFWSQACDHCGGRIPSRPTGRPPRFCSTRCRVAAHRAARRVEAGA